MLFLLPNEQRLSIVLIIILNWFKSELSVSLHWPNLGIIYDINNLPFPEMSFSIPEYNENKFGNTWGPLAKNKSFLLSFYAAKFISELIKSSFVLLTAIKVVISLLFRCYCAFVLLSSTVSYIYFFFYSSQDLALSDECQMGYSETSDCDLNMTWRNESINIRRSWFYDVSWMNEFPSLTYPYLCHLFPPSFLYSIPI